MDVKSYKKRLCPSSSCVVRAHFFLSREFPRREPIKRDSSFRVSFLLSSFLFSPDSLSLLHSLIVRIFDRT